MRVFESPHIYVARSSVTDSENERDTSEKQKLPILDSAVH